MSCIHCKNLIQETINNLEGIQDVQVYLEDGNVKVSFDEKRVSLDDIMKSIEAEGYEIA